LRFSLKLLTSRTQKFKNNTSMKKLLGVLVIAAAMTACNNSTDSTATKTDSAVKSVDSTVKAAADTIKATADCKSCC
jgi:hypothetical protein